LPRGFRDESRAIDWRQRRVAPDAQTRAEFSYRFRVSGAPAPDQRLEL
jgi:hypothetical protein